MKTLICVMTALAVSTALAGPAVCGNPDAGDCSVGILDLLILLGNWG